jgi:hypothetical protein
MHNYDKEAGVAIGKKLQYIIKNPKARLLPSGAFFSVLSNRFANANSSLQLKPSRFMPTNVLT